MTLDMPTLQQVVTPNYSPVPIAHDLIVFHRTEGGFAGSLAWLCLKASSASAHLMMKRRGEAVAQLVPLSMKAWAQCAFNSRGVSIEIEGFTADGMDEETIRAAAKIAAWCCRVYAIPPVWAKGGRGRGLCQHADLGLAGGGHHDCSEVGSDLWLRLVTATQDAFDAFGEGPLPAWALHGLPAPHTVALPPDAPSEPSHGGAARNEPGDVDAHPTRSGYPHGSVADLQWRLNAASAAALAVDGFAGPATRAALAAFQRSHRLTADGLIGPLTWAALNTAAAD